MSYGTGNLLNLMRVPWPTLSRLFAAVASSGWALAGILKILAFARGRVGVLAVPAEAMAAVGAMELVLAIGWWIPRLKRPLGLAGVVLAIAFGVLILLGLLDAESCGCFGSLRVSRARHLLVIGVLVASGSLAMIFDDYARRRVST